VTERPRRGGEPADQKGLGMAYMGINRLALILSLVTLMIGAGISTAEVDHTKYDKVTECTRCHPRMHPTHWQQMPADMQSLLPLDEKGRISCTTCHICTRKTCDLRETKEDLCKVCHDCTQGMACVLGTAHLGNSKHLAVDAVDKCLNCHESEGTPQACAIGNRTVHTTVLKAKNAKGPRRKITLVDGEVTCLSCHNPYTADEFAKLIKSNRDSELCTTCHGKLKKFDHSGFAAVKECITCHPRAAPTHLQQRPNFMKASLPLDEKGRMLCTTCHICVKDTCAIRGKKEELCQVCHDCMEGMACLIGVAHLGNSGDVKRTGVDACIDCHDTTVAPKECRGLVNRSILERINKTGETCVTCHNPYGDDKTPLDKMTAANIHAVDRLKGDRSFCLRMYVEIMDDEQCKRCHTK
jgi:predicted CXXCH cytochrome family protein